MKTGVSASPPLPPRPGPEAAEAPPHLGRGERRRGQARRGEARDLDRLRRRRQRGRLTHRRQALTVTREQAANVQKAVRGIEALLKRLPPAPQNAAFMYSVFSNLTIIQTTLAGTPRVSSN